jgi:hypothetical protein
MKNNSTTIKRDNQGMTSNWTRRKIKTQMPQNKNKRRDNKDQLNKKKKW